MITIDQLLESVDLDFEPRFVTKDLGKHIEFWSEKPKQGATSWRFDTEGTILCSFDGRLKLAEFENKPWQECIYEVPRKTDEQNLEKLKLSEFANKHWTECIYEVPRKTTGKIEKLPTSAPFGCQGDWREKINELVDAVNKHADIIQQIGEWGTRKGECLWCEKLTKFEPTELKGANNE